MNDLIASLQSDWMPVWFKVPAMLRGLYYTAIVSVFSFGFALVIGMVITLFRMSGSRVLSVFAYLYVQLFRSLSLYVYILFIYFGLAAFLHLTIDPVPSAILSLTLLNSAYISEIYRSALASVDNGQRDAAAAVGLSGVQSFFEIILPQALRVALPMLGNQLIIVVKDSSIIGVIGVADLMYEAQRAASISYRQFEFLTTVAVIYIGIVFALSYLVSKIELRYRAH